LAERDLEGREVVLLAGSLGMSWAPVVALVIMASRLLSSPSSLSW
jgi:hypothetical protein